MISIFICAHLCLSVAKFCLQFVSIRADSWINSSIGKKNDEVDKKQQAHEATRDVAA